MDYRMLDVLRPTAAVVVGAVVGLFFGALQNTARRRHEERERSGQFKNAWMIMPGSGGRIAMLMIGLALVQIGCPAFFGDYVKWSVSGGVVLGYGIMLFRQLQERRRANG